MTYKLYKLGHTDLVFGLWLEFTICGRMQQLWFFLCHKD